MSNHVKGETTFEALGKSWRFKMGNMAFIELETVFSKSTQGVLEMFQDKDTAQMTLVQAVVIAGLRRYQADITKEDASDIIDDIGLNGIMTIISTSVSAALPEKDGSTTENPK